MKCSALPVIMRKTRSISTRKLLSRVCVGCPTGASVSTHYRLRNVEATIPAMIHGEAEQPWVRRTLVPSTALLIRSAVADSVADWLVARLDTGALRRAAREFLVQR